MITNLAKRLSLVFPQALTGILSLSLSACATLDETVATNTPITAAATIDAGDQAARSGNFDEALTYYIRAATMDDTPEAWFRVGAASSELNREDRALAAYLRVIELDPLHAGAREGAGLAYLALRDADEAEIHLREAVEIDSLRWRSHNALGILADQAGNSAVAAAHYEAAIEINPNSPMLVNNLGYSRYLAGNLDQAARDFYRATELRADYSPAWVNLGRVYADREWYADAVSAMSRAMDQPAAYNEIGYIAYRNGDLAESERLLREAIRLSPSFFPAANRTLELVRSKIVDEESAARDVARRAPPDDLAEPGRGDDG